MTDSIRDLMERWARYRHFRHGGYGKTMLQRIMDGMPGTICPTCAGRRILPGYCGLPYVLRHRAVKLKPESERQLRLRCKPCGGQGEVVGKTCLHCRGQGYRWKSTVKVNPAYIGSTYREPSDPVSERIDRLVSELKRRNGHALLGYYLVIYAEYCDSRPGTQEAKALRMGISAENYRKRLQRGLEWIEKCLDDQAGVLDDSVSVEAGAKNHA
ncbi:MAG: hypothetical protein MZW92_31775 [Comamonadaceae bacterium]|nr:hypothetical protein [Comamonadaceae bacterium]